jgi:hypothetical protein
MAIRSPGAWRGGSLMGRGPETYSKRVSFFLLRKESQGRGKRAPEIPNKPISWVRNFQILADRPWSDKMGTRVIFDPRIVNGVAVLGMHKTMDTQFMTQIDMEHGKIEDFLGDTSDDALKFAHSTAVAFTNVGNYPVAAMALGSGVSCPRQGGLAEFMNKHFEPQAGRSWRAVPVVAPDETHLLKEALGAVDFSANFVTGASLFQDEPESGPMGAAHRFASQADSEIEGRFDVRLAQGYRENRAAQRNFKDVILKNAPFIDRSGNKRPKVTAVLKDGTQEVIELAEHEMTTSIGLNLRELAGAQFSTLLEKVAIATQQAEPSLHRVLTEHPKSR